MNIQQTVQAAINKARHQQKNDILHPDDEQALKVMLHDLQAKITELEVAKQSIQNFQNSLSGHYS